MEKHLTPAYRFLTRYSRQVQHFFQLKKCTAAALYLYIIHPLETFLFLFSAKIYIKNGINLLGWILADYNIQFLCYTFLGYIHIDFIPTYVESCV
jgi:hypothetical protein